ncbi:MAG: D-2-hydroxyacid dehydrogenase, partial [Bacteroidetes bacterium]|nr:D-2-hydroxyacid dehydrogenase [Bacteroidota bacterium]
ASSLQDFDALFVRSATKVTQEVIEASNGLRLIGRAGVGLDNIDIEFAKHKGIKIINTPEASSQSVAELVFAHLFTMARMLHDSNRNMPTCDTKEKFDALKKKYSAGIELRGKTLGIIGFGKIGQATARIALGLGMNVMPFKLHAQDVKIEFDFFRTYGDAKMSITMKCVPFEKLLAESDFITMHVPFPKGATPVITKKEIALMKNGVGIVNTSRGGVVVEDDLIEGLNSGKIAFAALDVFKDEPVVRKELREHPKVSLSPHIGGSTKEAQERIGIELASKVVNYFKGSN